MWYKFLNQLEKYPSVWFYREKIWISNLFDRASIQPILERRGMDINRVNVFVEASNTPLPLDCECFLLGGNTLNIKGRQYSREEGDK